MAYYRAKRVAEETTEYLGKYLEPFSASDMAKWSRAVTQFQERLHPNNHQYNATALFMVCTRYPGTYPILDGHLIPRYATVKPRAEKAKSLYNLNFSWIGAEKIRIPIVSKDIRDFLKRHESGKFHFYPFELRDQEGEVLRKVWLLYSRKPVQAIANFASGCKRDRPGWKPPPGVKPHVLKSAVKGRHVVLNHSTSEFFFSDAFLRKFHTGFRVGITFEALPMVSDEVERQAQNAALKAEEKEKRKPSLFGRILTMYE